MGARLVKFDFCPKENEQIDAVVRVPEEKRSVIHGVVKDWRDKVVKDAVVKLFEVITKGNTYSLKPVAHTFTDEWGQFLFGPLTPHKKYAIKVWFNEAKVRELIVNCEDSKACDTDKQSDNSPDALKLDDEE